ncbi:hypothetical protein [Glycomyces rhizosphaerae]|uniref:Uncharacterized protein n=1 Tax=Glycomyces rhizosphaerae TaxID=2054422 RepID=A0ABV7Q321_9ACTN
MTDRTAAREHRFTIPANRHPDYAEPLPGKAIDSVIAAELLGALTAATRPDPLESRA